MAHAAQLSAQHTSALPIADVAGGAFVAVDVTSRVMALTLLIFSGGLAAGFDAALTLMLAAVALSTAVLAWRGAIPIATSALQDVPIAVLVVPVAGLAGAMTAPEPVRVLHALAIMGLTSLLMGVSLWTLGRFGAARLVRFLPFPVMAGFLAGTGFLLLRTGLERGVGVRFDLSGAGALWSGANLPAVFCIALALAILGLQRMRLGVLSPLLLACVVALFYGLAAQMDMPAADLRAAGWLPDLAGSADAAFGAFPIAPVAALDPSVLWAALPVVISASLISLIAYMLTISGVELATQSDVDLDAELKVMGAANMLTGWLGASPCYLSSSSVTVSQRIGVTKRSGPVVFVGVMMLGALFAADLVPFVPSFVLAGLVLATGLTLLDQWLLSQWRAMPWADWGVVGAIVLATMALGILPAVLLGLVIATAIFSWRYGRLRVFRRLGDLTTMRSTVDRATLAERLLDTHGSKAQVMVLRGYLFFGSAEQVVAWGRACLKARRARYIILDFSEVSGIDPTAYTALAKLLGLSRSHDAELILCGLTEDMVRVLGRAGIGAHAANDSGLALLASLDDALEYCEGNLLAHFGSGEDGFALRQTLLALDPDPEPLDALLAVMDRRETARGDVLIERGAAAGEMFFVQSGQVAVMVPGAGGTPFRVRAMGPGALVGEIASYTGAARTADVIVDRAGVVFVLGAAQLRTLEQENPRLAAYAHRLVAAILADKLTRTTRKLAAEASQ